MVFRGAPHHLVDVRFPTCLISAMPLLRHASVDVADERTQDALWCSCQHYVEGAFASTLRRDDISLSLGAQAAEFGRAIFVALSIAGCLPNRSPNAVVTAAPALRLESALLPASVPPFLNALQPATRIAQNPGISVVSSITRFRHALCKEHVRLDAAGMRREATVLIAKGCRTSVDNRSMRNWRISK